MEQSVPLEVYKTIFETWRSQVNSYWQRSNYFAVFETAALAGCWSLMGQSHTVLGLLSVVVGISLTIIWWGSNSAVHRYVEHWWNSLKIVEKQLSLQDAGLAFATNHRGSGGALRYSSLVQTVPLLFMAGWIVLALYGMVLTNGRVMKNATDLATILAAVAGLWAIAVAWLTYAMMTHNDNKKLFASLKSLASGVRSELDLMRSWASPDGDGYLSTAPPDASWSVPTRIIHKFGYDTIKTLPSSPYVYYFDDVSPFVRLAFSISKLFQYYDEYRTYALSRLDLYEAAPTDPMTAEGQRYLAVIFEHNRRIHMELIGGKDTPEQLCCLYKTYKAAYAAMDSFSAGLQRPERLPWWFNVVHVIAVLCFVAGGWLLYALVSK